MELRQDMAEPLAKHLLYGVQVILAREPVDNPWRLPLACC